MLSYRKLAMRVLGRPLNTGGGNNSPRPASQRAAALVLTAAMLTTLTAPAFAKTWYIEDGDITISAGKTEGTNKVTQGTTTDEEDTNTTITNRDKDTPSSNTVTIKAENENDKVEVKLEDVNIDASSRVNPSATTLNDTSYAAVNVTGKGDTNIELDGDNELKSGRYRAGLEHNQTADSEGNVTSGKLTIQDDKDNAGSLTATGGESAAGIGGGNANAGQVTITGGNITATGGYGSAGIGGGYGQISPNPNAGDGDVTISGGTIKAAGGTFGAGIGGGYIGDAHVTITGDATVEEVQGGEGAAGIGSGAYASIGEVEISGNAKIDNVTGGDYGAGIGGGFSSPWDGGSLTGNGKVTIKDNAGINNAQGGSLGAGIGGGYGGGYAGLGDVTIEGNVTIKGRSKNMLLGPNGQNIYPEEIEDKLNNLPYVAESIIVQQNEKLVGLVYPDFDDAFAHGLNNDDIERVMEENRVALNAELPAYCQISKMKIYPEEFEKTPKKSIKRFLYQEAKG